MTAGMRPFTEAEKRALMRIWPTCARCNKLVGRLECVEWSAHLAIVAYCHGETEETRLPLATFDELLRDKNDGIKGGIAFARTVAVIPGAQRIAAPEASDG